MKNFDLSALTVRNLQLLIGIVEAGSVSDAAAQLGMSQSSASHSLDRLRMQLGDVLFVRVGRKVAPTDFTRQIYPNLKKTLVDLEAVLTGADFDIGPRTHPVTVAAHTTEMLPILRRLEREIRKDGADIRVRFIELGNRSNTLSILESAKADIAVVPALEAYPVELEWEALYRDEFACFRDRQRPARPLTLDEYAQAAHATLDFGADRPSIVDGALDKLNIQRRVLVSAANSYVLGKLMRSTPYIATLPRCLAETAFEGFDVSAPPLTLPTLSYHFVWHRRVSHSSRHKWLWDKLNSVGRAFSNDLGRAPLPGI